MNLYWTKVSLSFPVNAIHYNLLFVLLLLLFVLLLFFVCVVVVDIIIVCFLNFQYI